MITLNVVKIIKSAFETACKNSRQQIENAVSPREIIMILTVLPASEAMAITGYLGDWLTDEEGERTCFQKELHYMGLASDIVDEEPVFVTLSDQAVEYGTTIFGHNWFMNYTKRLSEITSEVAL